MKPARKPLKINDFGHPFYRPLWRRIVIFAVAAAWVPVEYFSGSPGWAVAFAALAAYLLWGFFLVPLPAPPAVEPPAETSIDPEEKP